MERTTAEAPLGAQNDPSLYVSCDGLPDRLRADAQGLLEENCAVGLVAGHYDESLTVAYCSRVMRRNLCLPADDPASMSGRSLLDFIRAGERPSIAALASGDLAWPEHMVFMRADGTPAYAIAKKRDAVDDDGRRLWMLSVRISPEGESLSLVNDALKTGTWTMDCDPEGNIVSIVYSDELRRIFGYRDENDFPNTIGTFYSIVHPDDLGPFREALGRAIADTGNDFDFDRSYRVDVPGRGYTWMRSIARASRRLDGSFSRCVGIAVNIDESERLRAHADELLRDAVAKDQLINTLVRLVDRYAICDLDANSYAFHHFDSRLGYAPTGSLNDLVRQMDENVELIEEERDFAQILSAQNVRSKLRTEKDIYRFNYRVRGEQTYLSMAVAPLSFLASGEVSKFLLVTQDVTESMTAELDARRALKEAYDLANRASAAKSQFLSQMSHEIRTPMNGIVGMTALAAAHADDPERVRDSLRKITSSSRHLLSLINEVLDMSKIESGNISLTEEEFNLSDLFETLITMVHPQVEEKGHDLSVSIRDLVHEDVVGDPLRIQQVFVNLMGNAIKYTPAGGHISVTVSERPSNQGKVGCYEFVFEDDGIGMTAEEAARVFEPFARARDSRVEKVGGAGLGLPISRNIVRMMGGDIHVESRPNVGTRFVVTVYLKLQDRPEVDCSRFVDLDVLVADDDPMALESCCDMLNGFGMHATPASTGLLAVEMALANHEQKRDFFACILDLKMPDIDGIECARRIRAELGPDVPIIVISAYDWSDVEAEAREAGVDAFIAKPLFKSRLVSTFEELLDEKGHADEDPLAPLLAANYAGRRVLVVEDNRLNSEVACEIVRMTGAEVECAADGEEAVALVASGGEGRYDLVLMDVMMPRMDGLTATRLIRSQGGYASGLPIVAMTANAFAEDVRAAKAAGMNEHIAKPLDLRKLARVFATYWA